MFLEIVCLDFFIMNIDMLYYDIFYGGFVLYICVVGYKYVSGDFWWICVGNGSWNGIEFWCKGVYF